MNETGLTIPERVAIRGKPIDAGFTRIGYTNDDGYGVYSETYTGPGNTSIVLTWAPRKLRPDIAEDDSR